MRINDDLSQGVLVEATELPWTPSPMPGVDRKMLFRVGGEVARATSIVRYAPGASFSRHTHSGGEEILVLDGVFQDEHGDYPAGSYFRNPPGTSHVPASAPGCTIFVRLWQFRSQDCEPIVRRPDEASDTGVLFDDGFETVRMQDFPAGSAVVIENTRGLEVLLVSGCLIADGREVARYARVRLPAGQHFDADVGNEDVRLWIKDAPLIHADACPLE